MIRLQRSNKDTAGFCTLLLALAAEAEALDLVIDLVVLLVLVMLLLCVNDNKIICYVSNL